RVTAWRGRCPKRRVLGELATGARPAPAGVALRRGARRSRGHPWLLSAMRGGGGAGADAHLAPPDLRRHRARAGRAGPDPKPALLHQVRRTALDPARLRSGPPHLGPGALGPPAPNDPDRLPCPAAGALSAVDGGGMHAA